MSGDEWKTLGRPPTFDGKEDEWNEWSFVMRSYCAVLHPLAGALLEHAEDKVDLNLSLTEIEAKLGVDGRVAAQRLHYALVMAVKGSAQASIRSAEPLNGSTAWRALYRRCEPNTLARMQPVMSAILNVKQFPNT